MSDQQFASFEQIEEQLNIGHDTCRDVLARIFNAGPKGNLIQLLIICHIKAYLDEPGAR